MPQPYTAAEVDTLIEKFEKAAERQAANKNAPVRLRAAERDLLAVAEASRDLMQKAVKRPDDRDLLQEVFGSGGCARFHRFRHVMETVEFSEMHAGDQRWGHLKAVMITIEEILKQMGQFKPWQIGAKAPETITYTAVRGRYSPGERVKLNAISSGGEPTYFTVSPELPEGLKLDPNNGEIRGVLRSDVEIPEATYWVTGGNDAGETCAELTFSVTVPPPTKLRYPEVKSCYSGEEVSWDVLAEGGPVKEWSISPALPKGVTLDQSTGTISGIALEAAKEQEYTVTAINGGGKATCSIKFEVKLAPPIALDYPDAKPSYPMGVTIYAAPDVTLQTGERVVCKSMDSGTAATGPHEEKRLAEDGKSYSRKSFIEFMGPEQGSAAFEAAEVEERRYADDGQAYTKQEFIDEFGEEDGKQRWDTAAAALPSMEPAPVARPSSLFRSSVNRMTINFQAITSKPATVQPKMTFSVDPELPAGLTLVRTTGVITGAGTCATPEQTYTVTVSNASGSVTCDLQMAIELIAPSSLSYPEVQSDNYAMQPMSLNPEVEGLVTEWSVEPALPAGLGLDPQGCIQGVPQELCSGTWTITAKNAAGETTTSVSFSVVEPPPSEFSYPGVAEDQVFPLQRAIVSSRGLPVTPSVSGRVAEYSVQPALPKGITLDPRTGELGGIPTETAAMAVYTITAKNDTGSCTAEVKFELKVMPPEDLSYPSIDDMYCVGETVSVNAEVVGGANRWTVEPELPEGLSLDPATGLISGSPTNIADEASYVVTASNDAGGTSTVLTFGVAAPPPAGLSYPEVNDDYLLGVPMELEPLLEQGFGAKFSIEPELPGGLSLNPDDGTISGTPEVAQELTTYKVIATNVAGATSCEITFMCSEEPEEAAVDQNYAAMIENITDLADMVTLEEPSKSRTMSDWMIWMVHRAWLNDPTLTDLNFNNLQMPLPHLEPRVAPKLMKALQHNTNMTALQLVNSNMQKPQGYEMAESLKKNSVLQILNIESNYLDSDAMKAIAVALQESPKSALENIRFNNQKHVGEFFGRPVEEAFADLLEKNNRIVKLGFRCGDPHWRLIIDRNIMRNVDMARRRRKKSHSKPDLDALIAIDKTLSKIIMEEKPEDAVWEIFEDDNAKLNLARAVTCQHKRLPTKEQLQSAAKAAGTPLKYSEVAPLLKDFRTKLFDVACHCEVQVYDAYGADYKGVMRCWTEKNENWAIDVNQDEEERLLKFSLNKQPIVELSDDFAVWLKPSES